MTGATRKENFLVQFSGQLFGNPELFGMDARSCCNYCIFCLTIMPNTDSDSVDFVLREQAFNLNGV